MKTVQSQNAGKKLFGLLVTGSLALAMAAPVRATLVADWKLDAATGGTALAGQVTDSAGANSGATAQIGSPFWATQTDTLVPVPNNPLLGAPADGRAVGMAPGDGHSFGQGNGGELSMDTGAFTIFVRYFNEGAGAFAIHKDNTFLLYFDGGSSQMAGIVYQSSNPIYAWGSSGSANAWHDYAMVFDPANSALTTFVDGTLAGQVGVNIAPADTSANSFEWTNLGSSGQQFIELAQVYNHALSGSEILSLSAPLSVPEPTTVGLLLCGGLLLVKRQRRQ